jgi:hypothetical protein
MIRKSLTAMIALGCWYALVVQCASGGGPADFGIRYGHVYGVTQGGIQEYDSSLQLVALRTVPGVTVTEGIAFRANGNLVFSAYKDNGASTSTHHVIELDSTGAIVNDIDLGIGSLDRVAHIDIDASGRLYVASTPNIVEIAADFSTYRTLPYEFVRSSGVAIGPDNRLYVSDLADSRLVIFDQDRNFERSLSVFSGPAGLAFDWQGDLYAARLAGEIRKIDLVANTSVSVLEGLSGATDIAFGPHGRTYVAYNSGRQLAILNDSWSILSSRSSTGFTDSIGVVVPEPPGILLLISAVLCLSAVPAARQCRS